MVIRRQTPITTYTYQLSFVAIGLDVISTSGDAASVVASKCVSSSTLESVTFVVLVFIDTKM